MKPSRRAWVIEWHDAECGVCGNSAWCLVVFAPAVWVSGRDPDGPRLLAICNPCLLVTPLGPSVGPEL